MNGKHTIWAILPDSLPGIVAALEKPEAGAIGESSLKPKTSLAVDPDNVAHILVMGVLVQSSPLAAWLGGTSYGSIQAQLAEAQARADVKAVLLHIDSPGGTVDGAQETAQAVKELARVKPVVAYSGGMVASAAYWIASGASRIVVSPTAATGSIGVVVDHLDRSQLDEKIGVKVTHVTSGDLKRILSEHTPLSKEGREYLQSIVDELGGIFVSDVTHNRNMTDEQRAEVQKAGVFVGKQGLSVGLVDEVLSESGAQKQAVALVQQSHTTIASAASAATEREASGGLAASKGAGGQAFPPSASETAGETHAFIQQVLSAAKKEDSMDEKTLDDALAKAVSEHNRGVVGAEDVHTAYEQDAGELQAEAEATGNLDEAAWDRALERAVADFNRNVA